MKIRSDIINLLPKEYKQAQEVKRQLLIMGGMLVLEVILFMSCIVIPLKIKIKETNMQLESLSLELNDGRFTDINEVIRQLEEAEVEKEEWTQIYEKLRREKFVSSRVLDSLLGRIPLQLTINQLMIVSGEEETEQEKSISIEGTSKDMTTILNYVTILEGVYGGEAIQYEMEYSEENKKYAYQISIFMTDKNLQREESIEEIEEENDGGEYW